MMLNSALLMQNDITAQELYNHLQKLIKRNVDFCDFYLQYNTLEFWRLDEGHIKQCNYSINSGISIRAICGDKTFLNYSNKINSNVITNLVNDIFIDKEVDERNTYSTGKFKIDNNLYVTTNPINLDSKIKANILNYIEHNARKLEFVYNVTSNIRLENDEICIVRSDREDYITDIRPLISITITITIKNNDKYEIGGSSFGGRYLLDKITDEVLDYHINTAYQTAILKINAKDAPSGQLPIVLGNRWAGVILHEAVGHGLEGDGVRKGSSAFSNSLGLQVASPLVTVVDNGSIANLRGSLNIDDEGNTTQNNILIENGVLKNYMFDILNAKLMNKTVTGNGRRESFAYIPIPRMTNTYMLQGNHTHEEIIASVKYGIYAENFDGGEVDTTSGQFVFNANNAWVIENGKISYPIKGCALVGNGPECLKHVSMVGNDLALDHGAGTCGKDGQSVPVGVGQPTIKIDGGLTVGGVI